MEEIEIGGNYYKWKKRSLYIRAEPTWLEYPTVRKRRLIVENTHLDYVHIGSIKMAERIK